MMVHDVHHVHHVHHAHAVRQRLGADVQWHGAPASQSASQPARAAPETCDYEKLQPAMPSVCAFLTVNVTDWEQEE